jgi:membrane fusion protein (multidrug efflux system)
MAEAVVLRPGAMVKEGQRLAAIVPESRVQLIAQFAPSAAMGRVRPGQPARLRLDGFPWAQYGSVNAKVTRVAGEVRDGQVRVEFAVVGAPPAVPLQHGLPGTVEVEVERTSPAALVLRNAGRGVFRGAE